MLTTFIGSDAGPPPGGPNQFTDQGGNSGILAIGWGSGTANLSYLITVGFSGFFSVKFLTEAIPSPSKRSNREHVRIERR